MTATGDCGLGWICDGCAKVTTSRPVGRCQDCSGHFRRATADDLACDRCGDPDGKRLLDRAGEFDRLCEDCIQALGLRDGEPVPDGGESSGGTERVEKLGQYHWRVGGTEYRLTDLPSDPCYECGAEIPDDSYCYFREGPKADGSIDHICWDCGHEATGFGTHNSDGQPFTDGGTERWNPNADYVREGDAPAPICPDFAVVQNAIQRHRDGYRRPVQFAGDPFAEVAP